MAQRKTNCSFLEKVWVYVYYLTCKSKENLGVCSDVTLLSVVSQLIVYKTEY